MRFLVLGLVIFSELAQAGVYELVKKVDPISRSTVEECLESEAKTMDAWSGTHTGPECNSGTKRVTCRVKGKGVVIYQAFEDKSACMRAMTDRAKKGS